MLVPFSGYIRKDINQDKDETNFVQIVLAIKTISPNI